MSFCKQILNLFPAMALGGFPRRGRACFFVPGAKKALRPAPGLPAPGRTLFKAAREKRGGFKNFAVAVIFFLMEKGFKEGDGQGAESQRPLSFSALFAEPGAQN